MRVPVEALEEDGDWSALHAGVLGEVGGADGHASIGHLLDEDCWTVWEGDGGWVDWADGLSLGGRGGVRDGWEGDAGAVDWL